ncbi:MAG: heat-inducible transcription repressor HrcA [Candidatus Dadabacteria bacterium]|nr:heat-inducible transcription repressor HrcA [Candidatus Dadabacteria bacterium]NIS09422.1 heat-inducible transcription repressor HrcA [Candidatus Dadabacteria bacterium]NIV42573.1 heat-inducible transcription repressor HrcA [Candidatus Dadabacteria bacterium]NIY22660.1 heat-inducible transcription repressor HrcA [Candidatus Dadabacteria bacterium]
MNQITLSNKDRTILSAVVDYYIRTGNPVGSKTLLESYNLCWSPATIRNTMARFMDAGYLSQQHISAGRIPTDKAIHLYINSLMYVQKLSRDKIGFINQRYKEVSGTVDDLLFETSSVLSDISEFAGLATLPDSKYLEINSAKLVKIDKKKILLIIIFKGGITQKTLINLKNEIPEDVLKQLSHYLHSVSEHMTLDDLKTTVLSELQYKKDEIYNEIVRSILKLTDHSHSESSGTDIFIKGHESLIDKVNFNNTEDIKELIKAFEEKKYLIEILSKVMDGDGIKVFLGSDHGMMNGFSLVACSYGDNKRLGTIGVFGLLRMDYSKIIPLVDYTAQMVSNIVSNGGYYD